MATKSRTATPSTNTKTNSKRRILRELPLALLDDAWRCTLFIVDVILIATLAFSALVLVTPVLRTWIPSP
jgi:hypothetical protein